MKASYVSISCRASKKKACQERTPMSIKWGGAEEVPTSKKRNKVGSQKWRQNGEGVVSASGGMLRDPHDERAVPKTRKGGRGSLRKKAHNTLGKVKIRPHPRKSEWENRGGAFTRGVRGEE